MTESKNYSSYERNTFKLDDSSSKTLFQRLRDKILYWSHRGAVGFYKDALLYDKHSRFFSEEVLFGRVQSYGGDIPFFGMTKTFERRHYRDWVAVEPPEYFLRRVGIDLTNPPKKVEFYLGGWTPEFDAYDMEEFDRGEVMFDYAFGEIHRDMGVNYDLTEHPRGKHLTLWQYRYPLLFPEPGYGWEDQHYTLESAGGKDQVRLRRMLFGVIWQCVTFVWFEAFGLPVIRLNPEGKLRLWWDQARDAYRDEIVDEDESWQGAFGFWTTCGLFQMDNQPIAQDYWDDLFFKGHLLTLAWFLLPLLDQGFASFAWYTLMKDNLSLTWKRFGFFVYSEMFLAFTFTLGSPRYCFWYMHGDIYSSRRIMYHQMYLIIRDIAHLQYKREFMEYYTRIRQIEWLQLVICSTNFHQMWYGNYLNDKLWWFIAKFSYFSARRIDVVYFNCDLQNYPFMNALDFARPQAFLYHPGMPNEYRKWVFTKAGTYVIPKKFGRRDYLAAGKYVRQMTYLSEKKQKWFLDNMTPFWFTSRRAPWLWEPLHLYDAAQPYQLGFQDPATPIMEGIIDLHHDLFFFFVVIGGLVFWLLFRIVATFSWEGYVVPENFYRNVTHHTTAEVVWTILPALILVIIATPSFSLLYAMEDIIKPSITVKVIGNQWYWSYEYFARAFFDEAEQSVEQNQAYKELLEETQLQPIEKVFDSYMVETQDLQLGEFRLLEVDNRVIVPTFTHIRFLITSSDVLHSFAVPSLGVKLDACPGRLNQTTAFITRQGLFYGQCSEICGINHAFMPIVVEAVDKGTMLGWLLK